MVHRLKCVNPYFNEVAAEQKKFEIRLNDRDFKVGNQILLIEIDNEKAPTGNWCQLSIDYIFTDTAYGLKPNYCVMGVTKIGGNV